MSAQAAAAAAATLPTGELGNKVKSGIWIAIAIIVVILAIVAIKNGAHFFSGISGAFDKILVFLNLKDGEEEKKADSELDSVDNKASAPNSPFNPTFYRYAPAGTKLKTQAFLSSLVEQIYNSVGVIWDNSEEAVGAFKQLSNWAQVSQLSDKFNSTYGKDVYAFMKSHFDTTNQKSNLTKIVNYSFSLPQYS